MEDMAVLIDARNVNAERFSFIMEKASELGSPVVVRAYGDFYLPRTGLWLGVEGVEFVRRICKTNMKSLAPMALLLDAIDLLYENRIKRFCIISNGPEAACPCSALKQAGAYVLGIGRLGLPSAFMRNCDRFVAIGGEPVVYENGVMLMESLVWMLDNAVRGCFSLEFGNTPSISAVLAALKRAYPEFSPSHYGHAGLRGILEANPERYRVLDNDGLPCVGFA